MPSAKPAAAQKRGCRARAAGEIGFGASGMTTPHFLCHLGSGLAPQMNHAFHMEGLRE